MEVAGIRTRAARAWVLAATLLALAGACDREPEGTPAGEQGEILIAAAASLRELIESTASSFQAYHPGCRLRFSFEASSTLARKIEEGAAFDVFLSADADTIERVRAFLDEATIAPFLSNRLALVGRSELPDPAPAPHALPRHPGVIALAGPAVPAGKYARAFLEGIGVLQAIEGRVVDASSVRGALALVESGAADYAIVYATDVGAARHSTRLWVDEKDEAPAIRYVAGALRGSRATFAKDYVRWLGSERFLSAAERLAFRKPGP